MKKKDNEITQAINVKTTINIAYPVESWKKFLTKPMLLNFEETKDTCEEHIKIIINIASAKCSKHDNLTFYFNQFLHYLLNQNFKNLILIRFKGIEANYLYVLSKKIHLKN